MVRQIDGCEFSFLVYLLVECARFRSQIFFSNYQQDLAYVLWFSQFYFSSYQQALAYVLWFSVLIISYAFTLT